MCIWVLNHFEYVWRIHLSIDVHMLCTRVHVLVPCSDVISIQAVSVLFQDVLIVICGYSCVKYSTKFSLSLNRHQNQQFHHTDVSVLCRVSCVPTSCFLIWFVSCPCLMSLLVNSCPAVFVSLSMIYLCILVHACSVGCGLVDLLFPVYPVCESCLVLLCPALMSLLNINLSLYPRLRVPVPPSCVHRDKMKIILVTY